jgi:hypothetical protein
VLLANTSIVALVSGSLRTGVSNVAWYADLVRVPADAFRVSDSAPPKMFRHVRFPYAEPSTLPRSVPVFRDIRPRSRAWRKMSMSVTVELGSVGEGRLMKVWIPGW